MTAAEFIAACFWPFIVIAAFVLRKIRNTAAFPLAVNIVIVAAAAYVVLGQSTTRAQLSRSMISMSFSS
ncbi:hypothetical protein ACQ5SK_21125 [Bradyrhizobium japonicum]